MSCLWLMVALTVAADPDPARTLTGIVRDDSGRPIPGADVFISTAAPRRGVGVLCPSCYPDCRKATATDAAGKFSLSGLDPALKFRLLAVARGFRPAHTPGHITPEAGRAADIQLSPHDLDRRKPERVVLGRVVNEDGDPVGRAIVEPYGAWRGQGGQFGNLGSMGVDVLAVTDGNGEFRIGVGEDGDELNLRVTAPFLAPVNTKRLAAGPTPHTVTLGRGVAVKGRVVKEGRPLAGAELGMVQVDRRVDRFLGHFEFGCDREGRFFFSNLAPIQDWYVYGLMESLKDSGSIPARTLRTDEHGSLVDLGDLEVQPGYKIAGRLILADGSAVPRDTRVLAGRDGKWDTQTATVDADGVFAFSGLPPERLSLSVSVPGYRPSPKNASFDLLSRMGLLGMVRGDIDDLRFLLEPGPRPMIDFQRFIREDLKEHGRRRDAPLLGAPAGR